MNCALALYQYGSLMKECHLYCTRLHNSCVNLVIFFVMTLIRSLSLVRAIGSAIASGLEGLSLISRGSRLEDLWCAGYLPVSLLAIGITRKWRGHSGGCVYPCCCGNNRIGRHD